MTASKPTSDFQLSSFVGLIDLSDKLVTSAAKRLKTYCLIAGSSNAGKSKYVRASVLESIFGAGYTVIVLDPAIVEDFDWPIIGIQKLEIIIDDGGSLLASRTNENTDRKTVHHWLGFTEDPFLQSSESLLGLERAALFITTNDPDQIDSAFLINDHRFDFVVGAIDPQYTLPSADSEVDRRV